MTRHVTIPSGPASDPNKTGTIHFSDRPSIGWLREGKSIVVWYKDRWIYARRPSELAFQIIRYKFTRLPNWHNDEKRPRKPKPVRIFQELKIAK